MTIRDGTVTRVPNRLFVMRAESEGSSEALRPSWS